MSATRRPNHLAHETSPYLLQHAHNPVDWYPWGPEARHLARVTGRPIFLSIGYAACHWCHVMERESFENDAVAEFLNRHFVSIKVDREERPDIDEIYMNAVQLLTGAGGWPLSAFLTPELEPFYAGTYFPPEDLHGRPGFLTVLHAIEQAFRERPHDVRRSARELARELRRVAAPEAVVGAAPIGAAERLRAAADLSRRFDPRWGGFGHAPKFPPDGALELLLREHARSGESVPLDMVERTLDSMARGGIHDHVGGGFARYSVDEKWLVPHFEKMLYTQALLVPLYLDAWKLTRNPQHLRVVERTLDFVECEMTSAEGGFWSSIDADSEGEEGRFYVFSPEEIVSALGREDARTYAEIYGIADEGNFEGRSIPNLLGGSLEQRAAERGADPEELVAFVERARQRLLALRDGRVRPATDDKILTAWNGLMISAFARAHQALGRAEHLGPAVRAAEFVAHALVDGDRLRVTFRDGRAKLNGYLDDYAFFARGLVDLYEASFDARWLELARRLAHGLVRHFEDGAAGGFFFVADDHEPLLARSLSSHDGALPAGAGVATELLLRLGLHLDDDLLRGAAERALRRYAPLVERSPSSFASLLRAADLAEGPLSEVAVIGNLEDPATRALLAVVHEAYRPNLALAAGGAASELPLLRDKQALGGHPTAFVCRDYACREPVATPEALRELLSRP
jgi:uncharacterized protein YyaL (SSP411 family)